MKYLEESKLQASDYEAAIVLGMYELQNRKIDNKHGIADAVIKRLEASPEAMVAGKNIAEAIIKEFPDTARAQATQTGASSAKLTSFWQSFGTKDKTPKTDLMCGDKRFSLKMGPAQLMSGSKSESLATFNAAIEAAGDSITNDPKFKELMEDIDLFSGSNVTSGKVGQVLRQGTDKVLSAANEAHHRAKQSLRELVNTNEDFSKAFAREAMSGFAKFGENSEAAAEFMLVCSKDGTNVKINSVYDDSYVSKIAGQMKMDCSFKSGAVTKGGEKTGEYRYFSTVRVGVDMMEEFFPEGNQSLMEFKTFSKITSKIKSKLTSLFTKALSWAKSSLRNTIKFFGFTADIKINNKINF